MWRPKSIYEVFASVVEHELGTVRAVMDLRTLKEIDELLEKVDDPVKLCALVTAALCNDRPFPKGNVKTAYIFTLLMLNKNEIPYSQEELDRMFEGIDFRLKTEGKVPYAYILSQLDLAITEGKAKQK